MTKQKLQTKTAISSNGVLAEVKITEFKAGMSFRAMPPFSQPKTIKVHIDYVLPSKAYSDVTLIVYRVFGKQKKWWHEFMCEKREMEMYIERAERK